MALGNGESILFLAGNFASNVSTRSICMALWVKKSAQLFTRVSYKGFGEGNSCPSLQQDAPVQREMISSKHHQETKTTPWKA
ncbi:hypothetical protein NC653_013274 [Populus alba x Populus x berolinensis]|uniref:Uncharacterized protein n=1 Tax=Populus alba x Populus x berolinensis TaxID=444605 RepID=A0AAD6W2T5_9ROSI|nr:hypothetical protein NC653_013274 [Populus alba x Populus x berolinensis]